MLQAVVHLAEMAIEEAAKYLKTSKTGTDEKLTIDCVRINPDDEKSYSAFRLKK